MIPFDQRGFLTDLTAGFWRPSLDAIFRRDGWDIVTNGHALLRLRGESPRPEPPDTLQCPPIQPILDQLRPNFGSTTMGSLCAWAALGGAYRRHCAYCESPSDFWETDRIEFAGTEINRALLWHYLKPLPKNGDLLVSWGEPLSAVLIAHEDWELYLMPLGAPDVKYTAPFVFDAEPATEDV